MITIREAKKEDLKQLVKLECRFAKFEHCFDSDIKIDKGREMIVKGFLKKKLKDKNSKIFVADDGRIAGYAFGWLKELSKTFKVRKVGYYCDCFIDERYRKRGIARKLTKVLLQWFKSKKVKYVGLDTFVQNKIAIKTWKSLGFEPWELHMIKKI